MLKDPKLRERIGVIGELASHIELLGKLCGSDFCKSLALRYVVLQLGIHFKALCNDLIGSLSDCLAVLKDIVGSDGVGTIAKCIEVYELIVSGEEVPDEVVDYVAENVLKTYMDLSRGLSVSSRSRQ
ncbi:MAG: hypothetical protein J7L12_02135 [Desulfurococcales archaeon]|nr:hypothetical protein [Desulfurococcales archaeon]